MTEEYLKNIETGKVIRNYGNIDDNVIATQYIVNLTQEEIDNFLIEEAEAKLQKKKISKLQEIDKEYQEQELTYFSYNNNFFDISIDSVNELDTKIEKIEEELLNNENVEDYYFRSVQRIDYDFVNLDNLKIFFYSLNKAHHELKRKKFALEDLVNSKTTIEEVDNINITFE